MTLLMTVLQMPSATTAATVLRVDAQHFTQHHSGGSDKSDSDERDRRSIDEVFEFVMRNSGHDTDLRRTRKTKRHSDDLYLLHHSTESNTDLEWANPCSGIFEISRSESDSINPPPSYYLSKLRRVIGSEFHSINDSMHTIDISDMGTWSKYRRYYSFLPKVNVDSNIALKRWYRHLQTYVAAFAYLGRTQYKWDRTKHMATSATTRELNQLLLSARSILCEVETTINGSYPYPSNEPKLTAVSRNAMNRKLRFLTKRHINAEQPDEAIEPVMLDIQFVKSKYYHYLRRMWRVIRQKTKRNGQRPIKLGLSSESASESASFSANIEDLIGGDISDSRSYHSYSASDSSSASGSLEHSSEKRNRRQRQRQRRRQHKSSRKSAELPQL